MDKLKSFIGEENTIALMSGVRTLLWQTLAFVGVGALKLLSGLNMPAEVQVVVSLIVGAITKSINKKYQLGKAKLEK